MPRLTYPTPEDDQKARELARFWGLPERNFFEEVRRRSLDLAYQALIAKKSDVEKVKATAKKLDIKTP
jgi:hypothetical protein